MERGSNALAGREEYIQSHYFLPTQNERTIFFKGYYLSIYNEKSEHYDTHIDNKTPSTEYKQFTILPDYTVFVRGASIYFQV